LARRAGSNFRPVAAISPALTSPIPLTAPATAGTVGGVAFGIRFGPRRCMLAPRHRRAISCAPIANCK
jgi:hypothetical protein